jgi:hypothetical protein
LQHLVRRNPIDVDGLGGNVVAQLLLQFLGDQAGGAGLGAEKNSYHLHGHW